MEATQRLQAVSLARDFAKDWTTIEEVNGFFRTMMKSALTEQSTRPIRSAGSRIGRTPRAACS